MMICIQITREKYARRVPIKKSFRNIVLFYHKQTNIIQTEESCIIWNEIALDPSFADTN